MDKMDAAKLLTLIQLSYPASYRNMDDDWKVATINMWENSFRDVPYSIMEQALNSFRFKSKFPPTVAEIVEELRSIHYKALELESVHRGLENWDAVKRCRAIMEVTKRYSDGNTLGGLSGGLLGIGGAGNERFGASGDRLDRADRLPELGAAGRR